MARVGLIAANDGGFRYRVSKPLALLRASPIRRFKIDAVGATKRNRRLFLFFVLVRAKLAAEVEPFDPGLAAALDDGVRADLAAGLERRRQPFRMGDHPDLRAFGRAHDQAGQWFEQFGM